jgi:hypothetical protein
METSSGCFWVYMSGWCRVGGFGSEKTRESEIVNSPPSYRRACAPLSNRGRKCE